MDSGVLALALVDIALAPAFIDEHTQRQTGDGNWEVFVFRRDELHSARYAIDPHTETVTVFSVTQAFFEDGFAVRLEDED
jgi:hypothetical protein